MRGFAAITRGTVWAVVLVAAARGSEPLPSPGPVTDPPPVAVLEPLPPPVEPAPSCPVESWRSEPSSGMTPSRETLAMGVASCSNGSCHGGPRSGNRAVQSFSATIWADEDPHARAYETLHSPRSRRMARLLGIGEPHRAQRCLVCHSMQDVSPHVASPAVLADGVGCASCHGDATQWQQLHTLSVWKTLSAEARMSLGYRDLSSPTRRAQVCVRCHVGDEHHDVDHDLIAAGHPRLFFELAAYQRLEPRHWSPRGKAESTADFTARSWAAGQAAALEAVGTLLAARAQRALDDDMAGARVRWPEFAEFDCYACHRSLGTAGDEGSQDSPRRNPRPGQPSWQPWHAAAARLLHAGLEGPRTYGTPAATAKRHAVDLRRLLATDWARSDRERLGRILFEARGLAAAARQVAADIETRPHVQVDVSHETLDALLAGDPAEWQTWDAATQAYLALEAARHGGAAEIGIWRGGVARPAEVDTDGRWSLDRLRDSLRFPPDADSPGPFDAAGFQRARRGVP